MLPSLVTKFASILTSSLSYPTNDASLAGDTERADTRFEINDGVDAPVYAGDDKLVRSPEDVTYQCSIKGNRDIKCTWLPGFL